MKDLQQSGNPGNLRKIKRPFWAEDRDNLHNLSRVISRIKHDLIKALDKSEQDIIKLQNKRIKQ